MFTTKTHPMHETIRKFLKTEFQQELFDEACKNYYKSRSRIRLNNFSYALRELIRHILEYSSPNDAVKCCKWYATDKNARDQITRKHRLIYMIHGGILPSDVKNKLGIQLTPEIRRIIKKIDSLSKYTHINPSTFDIALSKSDTIVADSLKTVLSIFEHISSLRYSIEERIHNYADGRIKALFMDCVFSELDELSTHTIVDDTYLNDFYVKEINATSIIYSAKGTASCILQYGSDSDNKRGDGIKTGKSFPFTMKLMSPVNDLDHIEVEERVPDIDNRSFYE